MIIKTSPQIKSQKCFCNLTNMCSQAPKIMNIGFSFSIWVKMIKYKLKFLGNGENRTLELLDNYYTIKTNNKSSKYELSSSQNVKKSHGNLRDLVKRSKCHLNGKMVCKATYSNGQMVIFTNTPELVFDHRNSFENL